MRTATWIFSIFGIGSVIGGAYLLYLQWTVLKPLLLIFAGFFLILLGLSLLSGPRIYMHVQQ